MKVEYIYHSGFTIESNNNFLVFDYYMGDIAVKNKKTIVFVSHGHQDHFNPAIFDWQKENPDIGYVISSDIKTPSGNNIYKMNPYEKVKINNIEIKSFGSTDLGLSFLVKMDKKYIFHAGDLNWWHWDNDSPEAQLQEEKDFKKEVSKIDKVAIEIAFFPVDPRLGQSFHYGGKYFIEQMKPKIFFPMHFGDSYKTTKEFAHLVKEASVNIHEIEKRNQIFNIG